MERGIARPEERLAAQARCIFDRVDDEIWDYAINGLAGLLRIEKTPSQYLLPEPTHDILLPF
jgi:hypothetical protein